MTGFSIGIIGLGGVARCHLGAFEQLSSVRIASVCDVDMKAAQTVAARYGARAFQDFRQLLAHGGIDLAVVLTPASTHRKIVEDAARAGIDVLCEKPLAASLADAQAMVTACRDGGVRLFYGSSYRYLPAVREAHRLIRGGAIGAVRLMTEQLIGGNGLGAYRELSPVHYPPGGPGGAGGGMMDHGIHLVDIFAWFADAEIVEVTGAVQKAGAPPVSEYLVMRFASGAVGHLVYDSATYAATLPSEGAFSGGQGWLADGSISEAGLWEARPGSISVHGSKGSLRILHYANALYLNDADGLRQIPLSGRPAFGHFATQLEACIHAAANGLPPPVSGAEGLRALSAVLKAFAS